MVDSACEEEQCSIPSISDLGAPFISEGGPELIPKVTLINYFILKSKNMTQFLHI